jgi:hypothetical protein
MPDRQLKPVNDIVRGAIPFRVYGCINDEAFSLLAHEP